MLWAKVDKDAAKDSAGEGINELLHASGGRAVAQEGQGQLEAPQRENIEVFN